MRGEHTVRIDRPAEVVFALIADGSRNADWRPGVIEVSERSGDGGAGTVWRQLVQGPGGKHADADYVVTSWHRPYEYGYEVISGPVRGNGVYTLAESTNGETTVTFALTLVPRGALRILTGFVLRQMVDELDSLDRLRELLTQPSPGSALPPSP